MHQPYRGSRLGRSGISTIAAFAAAAGLLAAPASASHGSGQHWKRTAAQISPPVGDNVSAAWDGALQTAVSDWNLSTVIQSPLIAGGTSPRTCKPIAGTIQVCSYSYGQTGWLSLASIWLSGGHVSQATIKLNETYFGAAPYNSPSWRSATICRELGRVYGLAPRDQDPATDSTASCMEPTNSPAGNEHPDQHDYDQLLAIYDHVDMAAGLPGSGEALGPSRPEWGRAVGRDAQGRANVFERDLGNGEKVVTRVTWAG
ncbi:MAG TPA: hypothetical protein VEW26_09075 [Allosphingosinicella sp.]|nr:hypothetical protein [Allosphingosinicella sp.]